MGVRLRMNIAFCVIALLVFASASVADNLLVNGGFETVVGTGDGAGDWPSGYGYWSGDTSEIVAAQGSLSPFEGAYMLKFIYAGSNSPSDYSGSEVIQLVDLSAFAGLISKGYAVAVGTASFNRVHMDSQTDKAFGVELRAYAGDASTFLSQYGNSELALDYHQISTDGDTNTWESASTELYLPVTTGFVAVRAWASENVYNDLTGVEFDGHYADAATLEIIPGPATLSLLAFGGLALIRRRRK